MIDTRPTPANLAATTEDVMQELGERLEAMVQTMMQAFPNSWPEADRRELAMRQLGMMEDVA